MTARMAAGSSAAGAGGRSRGRLWRRGGRCAVRRCAGGGRRRRRRVAREGRRRGRVCRHRLSGGRRVRGLDRRCRRCRRDGGCGTRRALVARRRRRGRRWLRAGRRDPSRRSGVHCLQQLPAARVSGVELERSSNRVTSLRAIASIEQALRIGEKPRDFLHGPLRLITDPESIGVAGNRREDRVGIGDGTVVILRRQVVRGQRDLALHQRVRKRADLRVAGRFLLAGPRGKPHQYQCDGTNRNPEVDPWSPGGRGRDRRCHLAGRRLTWRNGWVTHLSHGLSRVRRRHRRRDARTTRGYPRRRCSAREPRLDVPLGTLQIGAQVRGTLIAEVAFLLESVVDDVVQLRRHVRIEVNRRDRGPIENRVEDDGSSRPAEGLPPRDHLVQDRPEREQVGSMVQRHAARLLGRHIRHTVPTADPGSVSCSCGMVGASK